MIHPFVFEPIYQERVWGGRVLEDLPGRILPPQVPIGESWDVVDRPGTQSVVRAGPWKGHTLRRLIEEQGGEVMGPGWPRHRRFPILVKWLDCAERLSLQVHPPAAMAASLGGEPKTENWYIARAAPGAALMVGLKPGVTKDAFRSALMENRLEECVHRFPVREGQSILVRSGQIHAIDAGNLILEIQQNSDTTYRVYDWGRVGLDGKPRQLHVEESLASIDFDDFEPMPLQPSEKRMRLATCDEFVMEQRPLAGGEGIVFTAGEQPRLLHVVKGRLKPAGNGGGDILEEGQTALLPFAAVASWEADGPAKVLITEGFAG